MYRVEVAGTEGAGVVAGVAVEEVAEMVVVVRLEKRALSLSRRGKLSKGLRILSVAVSDCVAAV